MINKPMEEIINELNEAWGKNLSYSGIMNVIKSHGLEMLGDGSSRMAFKIDETTCLKVAKNKFGIAQMKAECVNYNPEFDILADVHDFDHDHYIWSVCELCREATDEDFKNILGVPFSVIEAKIEDFCYDFKEDDIDEIDREFNSSPNAVEFMKKFMDFINSSEAEAFDLEVIENYGVTNSGKIKIIDYGLDEDSHSETIY